MNPKMKALKNKKGSIDIIIIRHGETPLNKEKRIRGWSDVPLAKDAVPTIKKTARELKGNLDVIVTSDLERATDTADIISDITGAPIKEVTMKFRPWDVGHHTGQPQQEVYKFMADAARHEPNEKIEGGESFNSFKDRFLDAVKSLKKKYKGQRVGIVTHHRGDRIFAAWHKKGFPNDNSINMDMFLSGGIDPGEAAEPVEY